VSPHATRQFAVAKKSTKPHIRRSVGDVITEIDIPTTHEDVTFESSKPETPTKFNNSLKHTVSNSGIVLFNLAFDENM